MRLESGRKFLYQWERDQRLEVPEGCTLVHFDNGTTDKALSVEVKDGFAEIPNIMLKVAADIRCYAWDGTTVVEHIVLHVEGRPMPAEYVYTETEVRRYDILLEELEKKGAYYTPAVDAEGNLSWEKSMERMPDVPGGNIRGPKGDTPVAGKDYYTQAEKDAFAKEVTDSVIASQKQYELIEDVTLEEAATSFKRTTDTNSVAYNFSAIRVRIVAPAATAAAQIIFSIGNATNSSFIYHQASNALKTSATTTNFVARNDNGLVDYYVMAGVSANNIGNCTVRDGYVHANWGNVTRIVFTTYPATVLIPAGTRIQIYGIRG